MSDDFDTRMSKRDFALFDKLVVCLKLEGREIFSSDDFRLFGLDRTMEDTQHEIGAFFRRLNENKLIEKTGTSKCSIIKSNHGHRIQQYRVRGLEVKPILLRSFNQ